MHFEFTMTLGQLITFTTVLIGIWRIEGLGRKYLVEHEILIRDYCERHNLKVHDLPTRSFR
jgi:hypothetical protein